MIRQKIKVISVAFQKEDVDIVTVVASLEKAKKTVKLSNIEFKEYPTYQRFNGKIEVVNGKHISRRLPRGDMKTQETMLLLSKVKFLVLYETISFRDLRPISLIF